jgi:two-component system osmolarity sensor histidine kinase EnvZ
MIADIDEIDAVIGQFLDFARGADEQKSENDLDAVAAEVAEHYRRINRKVSVAPGELKPFRFARLAVRRAITNLVDNALRHAGEPIEIEIKEENHLAVVDVLDRGPGIPASETERLKRPFTRLDAARSGPGGAGLGLAIVERIAQAHRGRLELLPREGGGLSARLTLSTDAPA